MDENTNITYPNDDQMFGIAKDLVADNKVKVQCIDGELRLCRIPGRFQKKVWIRENDLLIIEPWSWQDEKGDIEYRYTQKELSLLLKDKDVNSVEQLFIVNSVEQLFIDN